MPFPSTNPFTILQNDVTGNECWNVGIGPGGPNVGFMSTNIIRNTQGLQVFTGSAATVATPASINTSTYIWSGSVPSSWTITTPTAPYDGEILELGTDTTISTAVSIVAFTGQSLSTAFTNQTLSATASVEYRYNAALSKWFKLR